MSGIISSFEYFLGDEVVKCLDEIIDTNNLNKSDVYSYAEKVMMDEIKKVALVYDDPDERMRIVSELRNYGTPSVIKKLSQKSPKERYEFLNKWSWHLERLWKAQ